MRYPDGQEARLGDRIRLGNGVEGVVVCAFDLGQFAANHPAAEWSYLKTGVLVQSPQMGLIHYENPDPSMQLLSRADPV